MAGCGLVFNASVALRTVFVTLAPFTVAEVLASPVAQPAVTMDPEAVRRARAETWSGFRTPARAGAQAVGEYSNGCLVGGVALPPSGPGFESMRRSRHRFFAHPEMAKFLRRFARVLRRHKLGPLIVGDLSQPRGGPSLSGHRSHQTGLDADIGFRVPGSMPKRLRPKDRETLPAAIMIDLRTRTFTPDWGEPVEALLKQASKDQAVERIFVNPLIKFELCVSHPRDEDRTWLRKIRPWWGHHDHLHVRLRCPEKDTTCVPQASLPEGDGCNEVGWWFSEEATQVAKGKYDKSKPPPPPPPMPEACEKLAQESPPPPVAKKRAQGRRRNR